MKLLYAVMYTVNADFLGAGASYVDDKVMLKGLTEVEIAEYTGEVNRIDHLGFNPDSNPEQEGLSTEHLSAIMSGLVAQEPNHVLGVLSIAQGKWLHANHPDFMDKETNSEV